MVVSASILLGRLFFMSVSVGILYVLIHLAEITFVRSGMDVGQEDMACIGIQFIVSVFSRAKVWTLRATRIPTHKMCHSMLYIIIRYGLKQTR